MATNQKVGVRECLRACHPPNENRAIWLSSGTPTRSWQHRTFDPTSQLTSTCANVEICIVGRSVNASLRSHSQ